MPTIIHPTAIVEPGAYLDENVTVGAYAYIGKEVQIASGTRIDHHASIVGKTKIGKHNHFFPFVSIGQVTQDLKYQEEPTFLEIGDYNTFREFCTVNRGTAPHARTLIGNHNLFLAYVHIAHDCQLGDHIIMSNNGTLAGHVIVEDYVVIGGLSAVHQFCRIGSHSMIGGCTKIVQDVPPYFIADGNPADVRAVNTVGLQRRGFADETIRVIRDAYKILYDRTLNTTQALEKISATLPSTKEIQHLVNFVRNSRRGIIR
ncbi:MAG: acyl-ACP--UDP-N-acetylglucosamine O-acyltransferase [Methylacidiphilales bacterium]|nr:acyl-ACP--UDP-N-acetylglucosamine O-acyltransferase [Candidatus Methylacidiphilales bacterium]MDW8349076.1 acyl-ACP--UDP-N-acetylglucosamine O-acyltransferase [Verrucomicrobiae bacterium]